MKRYKFRLEAVLKVRRMVEESCRNELGMLMVEKQNYLNEVTTLESDIRDTYHAHEKAMGEGMKASHVSFFPQVVEGKEAHIKQVKHQITDVEKRIELKLEELREKKAELKAVEKLREKDFDLWKKAYNKEVDMKVEEMVQLWGENLKSQKEEL